MAGDDKPADDGGTPDPTKSNDGSGRNRLRRGRRGNAKPNQQPMPRHPKFEGSCEAMKGHVYDVLDHRQADAFAKTTKELAGYAGRTMIEGDDVRLAIENLDLPTLNEPAAPTGTVDDYQKMKWQAQVKIYLSRVAQLESNMRKLYSVIIGQCSESMINKLESSDEFRTISASSDSIALLKAIKKVSFHHESQKFGPHALHDAMTMFYTCRQSEHTSTEAYLETYNNTVSIVTYCGGSLGRALELGNQMALERDLDLESMTAAQTLALRQEAQDRYLAVAFLMGADKQRFGALLTETENEYLKKRNPNAYPGSITEAYSWLLRYQNGYRRTRHVGNNEVAFTHMGNDEPRDGVALATRDIATVTCYNCDKKGHYKSDCPNPARKDGSDRRSADQLLTAGVASGEFDDQPGFTFINNGQDTRQCGVVLNGNGNDDRARIPNTWILLDNQSTVDVFHNPNLLRNIRKTDTYMDIHCNAGVTSTNEVGDLHGYGTVWYHPNGIANILSLKRVKEKHRVTYDSTNGNEFVVHKDDGTTRIFQQSNRGLFYMDSAETGTLLVSTVAENKSKYTNRDYSRAVLAREIQKRIGRPSTKAFIKIVDNRLLPNCPITRDDILAAEHIFGPDVGSLKGKTVHRPSERVEARVNNIPMVIMERYREVVLGVDIMFVNRIPFMMTISRNIRFATSTNIKNQSNKTILSTLKMIKRIYDQRGFKITQINSDGQFESLRGDLAAMQIHLNVASNDEHVPEIERHIRTIKERTRCSYNMLPFKNLPPQLVVEMVSSSTFWWNSFPPEGGVSATLSPRAIVTGLDVDYIKHCQLDFGTYVQTHEEHTNSMAARTVGAIAMRPTGNEQGGYFFFSLNTGRRLNRHRWTVLPMPSEVVDRVHALARRSAAGRGLIFANRNGIQDDVDSDDDDDDESYNPDTDDDSDHGDEPLILDDPHHIIGVNDDENDEGDESDEGDNNEDEHEDYAVEDNADNDVDEEDDSDYDPTNDQSSDDDEIVTNDQSSDDDESNFEGETQDDIDQLMDQRYGARSGTRDMRARKPRDYGHLHTALDA